MPFLTDDNESTLENLGDRSSFGPNSGGQGSYTPPNPNSDPRAGGDTTSRLSADENRLEAAFIANQINQVQNPVTPPTPTLDTPPPKRPMDEFGPFEQSTIPKANGVVGANYFIDLNAHGFVLKKQKLSSTDYNLNDSGGPVIPQSKYLDSKGDFSPKYTATNKSEPNFRTPSSPIQDIPIPADLFLDSKGDFTPVFNAKRTAPNTNVFSRLLNLHTEDKFLDNYYARLETDTDPLGIRNDGISNSIFGNDNQPTIVRPIGKKWGVDTFQIPANIDVPDYVQKAIDTVNELGESIIGRKPSTYVDRYASDVIRLLPYANPLSIYAVKQSEFQKRNPFDRISSVKYGLIDQAAAETNQYEGLTTITKTIDARLNPRSYNPISIFSTPGVVMLNRNATYNNINDLPKDLFNIAGVVSLSAIEHAGPVAANIAVDVVKLGVGAAGLIGRALAGLSNPFSGLSNPFADMHNPFAGMNNPFAGMNNPFANVKNPFSKMNNPFSKVKNPFSKMSNPFSKLSLKGVDLKFPKKWSEGAQAIGRALGPVVGHAKDAALAAREIAKDFGEAVGTLGKDRLSNFDVKAFVNMKVDPLNLIPYAKDEYEGKHFTNLDHVPFKFHDIRENVPIVFRAILSGITDTFSPEYSSERYVGRPDKVHVYQGTDREISFTFDVYPKSDRELIAIWHKLNRLAGLTYPHMSKPATAGGRGMISPYTRLTIGQMYDEAPGFISSLTYNVMDEGTWETTFAKLPKYIQANVSFTFIGDYQMHAKQKLFDLPSIPLDIYQTKLKSPLGELDHLIKNGDTTGGTITAATKTLKGSSAKTKQTLGKMGIDI